MRTVEVWLSARRWRGWVVLVVVSVVVLPLAMILTGGNPYRAFIYHDVVCITDGSDAGIVVGDWIQLQCPVGRMPRNAIVSIAEAALYLCVAGSVVCLSPVMADWEAIHRERIWAPAIGVLCTTLAVSLGGGMTACMAYTASTENNGAWAVLINAAADIGITLIGIAICGAFYGLWIGLGLILLNVFTQPWQGTWGFMLRAHPWSGTNELRIVSIVAGGSMVVGIVLWGVSCGRGMVGDRK